MANLEAWIAEKYGPDLSKVTEITGAPPNITGKVFVPSRPSPLSQVAGGRMNKIPKHFLATRILTPSLTHTCSACFVNPIPHRRHPSAGKVYAADERRLRKMQKYHRWVLLRGTFFLQVAAQCAFLEEFSSMRILRELSRVAGSR